MIRFVSNLPYTSKHYDVIFTENDEIVEHMNLLRAENISFDTFVYVKNEKGKFRHERAFSFFISTEKDHFYVDILNPLDIGDKVVDYFIKKAARAEENPVKEYMEFSYELFEVRYQFYARAKGISSYEYNGKSTYSIKFEYPEFIRKYEKRNDFRLKLSMKTPVWFQMDNGEKKRLINLSASGAGLPNRFNRSFRLKEKVRFYLQLSDQMENLFMEAEIVHVSGNKIGIRFVPFHNSKQEVIVFKRKQQFIRKFLIQAQVKVRKAEKEYEEEIKRKREAIKGKQRSDSRRPLKKNGRKKNQPEKKTRSYVELNKPVIMIIDNFSRKEYEVLELKYRIVQSHYIRVESNLKLYPVQTIVFKPDYNNYASIAKLLSQEFPYRLIPQIVLTENYTKNFILNLRRNYYFQHYQKDPFHIHHLLSLINRLTEAFPLEDPNYEAGEEVKKLKFLMVSNCHYILEGLGRLFHDMGIRLFEKETNPHKMSSRLAGYSPHVLILDNSIKEFNVLRLIPILKRNPSYKDIKVIMIVTRDEDDIIDRLIKNQVDRYIFFPFKGDDILELIESLVTEIQ